jgi:hypothetical protein
MIFISVSVAMSENRHCIKKSTIFLDITPCSPLSVNRRFGGTYRLHLAGQRASRARSMKAGDK